jgi:putative FmdB family regulatory protein
MPIYEYECLKCGHQFEYIVLPQKPEASCPACKKKSLKQLISLYAVSSENTRQNSLAGARKKAAVVHKEKQHADAEYMRHHYEDHMPPPEKKKKKK